MHRAWAVRWGMMRAPVRAEEVGEAVRLEMAFNLGLKRWTGL